MVTTTDSAKDVAKQSLTVYGYIPAWGVPDISPYVTKLVNYLHMTGHAHEWQPQDLTRLDEDSPNGKLPFVVLADGTKITDSNRIIQFLEAHSEHPLNAGMTPEELAEALAWHRLMEEHLYWSGVIQPRWRHMSDFEIYIPYVLPGVEVTPELRVFLDAFRDRIVAEFDGQGMGRRTDEEVFEVFKEDVDALSSYLGDKPYFLGDRPRVIDATLYSWVRHLADVPWDWPGRTHIRGKSNLIAYAERMRAQYGV